VVLLSSSTQRYWKEVNLADLGINLDRLPMAPLSGWISALIVRGLFLMNGLNCSLKPLGRARMTKDEKS
jgi:hypothetical protein